MAVTVIGVGYDNEDGLQKSLQATFKANRENGVALINAHEAAEQRRAGAAPHEITKLTADRPKYSHKEWPKHVYHPDGRDMQVIDAAALEKAQGNGYRTEPYRQVKAALLDPAVEKANLQKQLAEKDGKIATLADQLAAISAKVDELSKAPEAKKKIA